jgi:hypothetical protein
MLQVIDDFYDDPDSMRELALNSKFTLIPGGNWMGRDTVNRKIMTIELEKKIKELFPEDHYQIICSRFRYALKGDTYQSFVHSDNDGEINTGWHILISLYHSTDDGIVLYEHVDYGKTLPPGVKFPSKDTENFQKFKPWKTQPYSYNRAVVLDYAYFHAPLTKSGFGDDITTSRLLHIIEVVDIRSSHYKTRRAIEGARKFIYYHPYSRENDDKSLDWSTHEVSGNEGIKDI